MSIAAIISLFVSVASFLVTLRLAWETKFRPPKLIGVFPYIILYTFEFPDNKLSDLFLVPAFWLTNIGARPMLVEDIHLVIRETGGATITLAAVHTVPLEAIDSPNAFDDYELLRTGKAPFCGFAVSPSERWVNNLAFELPAAKRQSLTGTAKISVNIRAVGKKQFKRVLEQQVRFARSEFNWSGWAGIGGPSAEYFYSTDWHQRVEHPND